jgi:hypothetical protein
MEDCPVVFQESPYFLGSKQQPRAARLSVYNKDTVMHAGIRCSQLAKSPWTRSYERPMVHMRTQPSCRGELGEGEWQDTFRAGDWGRLMLAI